MIRDASESGNDGMLIENYGMDDIDIDTLHSYRQIFEIRNHDHVFNGYNDKEFLRNLGGYTTERASGKEGLTVAGLLMFGKGLPVRDRFDNFRMDYLDQSNLLPGMRWSDRLTYDGNWANNLFNFFRLVLPKLSVGTKHPFKLDGIQRIDETLVDVAIREAFTNSDCPCRLSDNGCAESRQERQLSAILKSWLLENTSRKDLQGRLFNVTQSQNPEHVPDDRLRREHWLRFPDNIKGLERRKMARA